MKKVLPEDEGRDEEAEDEEDEEAADEEDDEEAAGDAKGGGNKKGGADVLGLDADSDSDDDDSESAGSASNTGLTEAQNRLLYLISLYTHAARTEDEKEEWIRKQAVQVLIYEGIVLQVLDYDYAPSSEMIGLRRAYFNVSQEGKSDLDFLREEELLNGLKLSSKEYQPITCYQISEKGEEVLKKLGKQDREAVHEMVYEPGTRELLKVTWDEGDEVFYLVSATGYRRKSTVMNTEDVSYVSSAYIPQCLRHGGRPTLSNAHRAHECGQGDSAIRDELDEVITLNSVSVIVSEFIPFGTNNIVQLNNNIGSTERVQGGFFTANIDKDTSGTKLELNPGLTSISILDYTLADHANFEANIHYPTQEGVVQVETFGISCNSDGTLFYGMQVEAVLDRIKDNISLDHLARLLVDVHVDSSKIIDSVISSHQRKLMDLVYNGYARYRDKVNLIVANEITPHLTAEEYMDQGEYENELKQVLGDTRAAYDISEHDALVFGAHGLLVAGPNSRHHEPLLCAYLQFQSTDLFLQNFFNRLYMLLDEMKELRAEIDVADSNPRAFDWCIKEHTKLTEQVIMLEEILGFIRESLNEVVVPPQPPEQSGRSLYERLQVADMKDQLMRRSADLVKSVSATRRHLELLSGMVQDLREKKSMSINESTQAYTRQLCDLQNHSEKSSKALEIIQILLAGTLAFDTLDRLTGQWSVVNTSWMRVLVEPLMKNTPFMWFILNGLAFVAFGTLCRRAFRAMTFNAQGVITLKETVNRKLDMQNLNKYLLRKGNAITTEEHVTAQSNELVSVSWIEPDKREWGYFSPRITLHYDLTTGYLLSLEIQYNRRLAKRNLAFNADELRDRLREDLNAGKIWADSPPDDGDGDKKESERKKEKNKTAKKGSDEAKK